MLEAGFVARLAADVMAARSWKERGQADGTDSDLRAFLQRLGAFDSHNRRGEMRSAPVLKGRKISQTDQIE